MRQYNSRQEYQLTSPEFEFELFSNQVHDHEFEQSLVQLASEAESKFTNYVSHTAGSGGELEEVLRNPNFENMFNQFYEVTYGSQVRNIQDELDRFSNYVQSNLQPEMEYEAAKHVIDSFQPVQPEEFLGKLFKKVKRVAGAALRKGVSLAKKGLSVATRVIGAPAMLILRKLLRTIGRRIRPLVRKILRLGLRYIPPQYRAIAQKALGALGGAAAAPAEGGAAAAPAEGGAGSSSRRRWCSSKLPQKDLKAKYKALKLVQMYCVQKR